MPRLRTVSPRMKGWTRRRTGRSFTFLDAQGNRLAPQDVARVKALAIPPAWTDVWICPVPNGHLQATGVDAAGRTQYLYHPVWWEKRDKAKFDRVLAAASHLPRARKQVAADLAAEGMPKRRALAAAVALLDLGYFRIGSDVYADAHGSFGLTTLHREHVRRDGSALVFEFVGKSGVEHSVRIDEPDVVAALRPMLNRRSGSTRLLAWRGDDGWSDLDAAAVNAYLSDLVGGELTAKDFRTWHATVLAAAALAATAEPGATKASRNRAVRAAVVEVSEYLGNTPTVAKNSYIDPRVIDLYEAGKVITVRPGATTSPARRQAVLEKAVLQLLAGT